MARQEDHRINGMLALQSVLTQRGLLIGQIEELDKLSLDNQTLVAYLLGQKAQLDSMARLLIDMAPNQVSKEKMQGMLP